MMFKIGSIVMTGLFLTQCNVKSTTTTTDTSTSQAKVNTVLGNDTAAYKLIDAVGSQLTKIGSSVNTATDVSTSSTPMAKLSDTDITAVKEAMTQEALADSLDNVSGTDAEVVTKLSAKLLLAGVKASIAQGKAAATAKTVAYDGMSPSTALRLTEDAPSVLGNSNVTSVDTSNAAVADGLEQFIKASTGAGNNGSFGSADAIASQIAASAGTIADYKNMTADQLQTAATEAASKMAQLYYAMTFAKAYINGVQAAYPKLAFADAQSALNANLTDFATAVGALGGATTQADLVSFQEFLRTSLLGFLSDAYGSSAAEAVASAAKSSYDSCVAAVTAAPPSDAKDSGLDAATLAKMLCSGALNNVGGDFSDQVALKYSDLTDDQKITLAQQAAASVYGIYTSFYKFDIENPDLPAEAMSDVFQSFYFSAAGIISQSMPFTEQSDLTDFGWKVLGVLVSEEDGALVPLDDAIFRSNITSILQYLTLDPYQSEGGEGQGGEGQGNTDVTTSFTLTSATYHAVASTNYDGYYDINVTITGTGLSDLVSKQLFEGAFPLPVTFNDTTDGGCQIDMDNSNDSQIVCTISQPTQVLAMDQYQNGITQDTNLLSKVSLFLYDDNGNYQGSHDYLTESTDWTYTP